MSRQHKIAILKYTTKNFWMLLIPLVRGLAAMNFDLYHWLQGAYWDLIVILLMIGFAVLRWYFIRFEVEENGIFISHGVLLRNEFTIPYSAVACASAARSLWLRPIRAVTVALDSDSHSALGQGKKADAELIMKLTDYTKIYNNIPNSSTNAKFSYRASKADLVFFSLVFSSTLSGVIFLGTLFIQGSRIVGNQLEEQFLNAVSDVTEFMQKIVSGVTPAAVALTLIFALGWGFSFASNLLRHINFRIQRCGNDITVRNGFFSKWRYYVNISKVNCADLRQNLLMKICRVMSVHVSCTGYGKSRNEIPVFVPITTKKRVMSTMQMMLPSFTLSNISLKPKPFYIMPFLWGPLLSAVLLPVGAVAAARFFPAWSGIVKFLLIMGEIPSLHLIAVKIMAKFTTGIGFGNDTITLKYCTFSQFHTVIVPKSRIAYVRLSRTIFQRFNGTCDVWVYSRGERASKHRIRGIDVKKAEEFFGNKNDSELDQ
ncbi:MAG: PH domain-containing protein [Oscillospiraceae bacterium]|nr:PH domain-containing protein [Oscillospiraceae bacterium]